MNLDLPALGWDARWDDERRSVDPSLSLRPARVTLQGRDAWRVHDGGRESVVAVRGRVRAAGELPVAGDWVLLAPGDDVVEHLLPRRTGLLRKEAGQRTVDQVVAANVDVVLVCVPSVAVNLRRLERELTLVWESGARPAVALTKCDLVADPTELLEEIGSAAVAVDVLAVSSVDGTGVDGVRSAVAPGTTLAVVGPSGAGKSTLVNALVGEHVLATSEVRASDGRGVHTTSARHLVPLPGGGLVLDTPGMREVSLWADEDALAETFRDVEDFAVDCRFSDCTHRTEPGCAVLSAVEAGLLDDDRLASWRRLQRELAFLARKQDARLAQEERRRWARLTRDGRARTRP